MGEKRWIKRGLKEMFLCKLVNLKLAESSGLTNGSIPLKTKHMLGKMQSFIHIMNHFFMSKSLIYVKKITWFVLKNMLFLKKN